MTTKLNLLAAGMFLAAAPWTALAQTTFTKITTGAIVNDGGSSFVCAWGDYDGDGFLDLLASNSNATAPLAGSKNFLYHNNRDGTFTRITLGPIANDLGNWYGGAWADYDNDGNLDLILTSPGDNAAQDAFLYRNNGDGTFTRMPANTIGGIVPAGSDGSQVPAWADYDNDGFLDLFVSRLGIDWLYHNNGNGSFTSVTNNLLGTATDGGFAAAWADYDNDGRPDLFVGVFQGDPSARRLYRNLGGGSFAQITSGAIITDGGLCVGSAWGDYDNDGYPDLFLSNLQTAGNNFLYRNNGNGTFTRMTSAVVGSIASDPAGFDQCTWGDYDNDGYLDLFVTATPGIGGNQGGNALYHNNGDGSFTRILTGAPVDDVANSVGCTWGDYDNDGFLDLFVANGGVVGSENNFLYHNNGNSNTWLKVKCVGTVSNRSAIGAKVRVKASLRGKTFWQLREINSGSGICQNPLEAHFGLADTIKVETLRIEWPSGIVQEFHDVAAKQFLTITEPPRLQALSRLTDGSFQFSLNGGRALQYRIEASTNLTAWSSVGTLSITNLNGTVLFTDSNAAAFGRRFYRAVLGD